MKNDDRKHEIALFRYGLISDLINIQPGTRGLLAKLRKKAEHNYKIPCSDRTTVAAETIRDWLKKYRKSGFDALLPKERKDRGKSRKLPTHVSDLLLETKEKNPDFTVSLIISHVRESGRIEPDIKLSPSTVYKLLARNGLMKKKDNSSQDHRRFSYRHAGELYMSDVMYGPAVKTDGRRKRKTYLIAFIDDATRVIPYAAFAMSENTASFMPVLKQAVLRRGIPQRLFVDNGSAFRSTHLSLICAKLGITLIHSRPYAPQGKGKIERWFRTVRLQFLPRLKDRDKESLETLNSALWAYVETEYHQSVHRILGQTPLEAWAEKADNVNYPVPWMDLDEMFLFETKRKVMKDRTVSLNGVAYEIDAALVGETVTLKYNPSKQGDTVDVWHNNEFVHKAKCLDAYANCFVKRDRPSFTIKEQDRDGKGASPTPSQPVDFSRLTKKVKEDGDV